MSAATSFNESDHPREGDGRFAAKDTPDSEASLAGDASSDVAEIARLIASGSEDVDAEQVEAVLDAYGEVSLDGGQVGALTDDYDTWDGDALHLGRAADGTITARVVPGEYGPLVESAVRSGSWPHVVGEDSEAAGVIRDAGVDTDLLSHQAPESSTGRNHVSEAVGSLGPARSDARRHVDRVVGERLGAVERSRATAEEATSLLVSSALGGGNGAKGSSWVDGSVEAGAEREIAAATDAYLRTHPRADVSLAPLEVASTDLRLVHDEGSGTFHLAPMSGEQVASRAGAIGLQAQAMDEESLLVTPDPGGDFTAGARIQRTTDALGRPEYVCTCFTEPDDPSTLMRSTSPSHLMSRVAQRYRDGDLPYSLSDASIQRYAGRYAVQGEA